MSEFEDQYHRQKVTAVSPDGQIAGHMNSQSRIRVMLRDEDSFYDYNADTLAAQLGALLRGLNDGRQRGLQEIFDRAGMEVRSPETSHWDASKRRYQAELCELVSMGLSMTGVVEICTVGVLAEHEVTIDQQGFDDMDMRTFMSEFHGAYRNLLQDFRQQRRQVQRKYSLE